MKLIVSLFLLGLGFQASAAPSNLEYRCVSKNGFRYVLSPAYGEIEEYDEKGKSIGNKDGLFVRTRTKATRPPTTVIQFVNHDGGNVEFTMYERAGKIRGEIDDDYTLVCERRHRVK